MMVIAKRYWDAGRQRAVLPESVWLTIICAVDAIYTLYAVRIGWARESNPLLITSLAVSDGCFLVVKGTSFLVPLTLLELLRPLRQNLIVAALRVCVVGYLTVYVLGSLALWFSPT